MELKRFTADQARELVNGEDSLFVRVMNTTYEAIRRKSQNRGRCVVVPCDRFNAFFTKRTMDALKEDGYKIEYDYLNARMEIRW